MTEDQDSWRVMRQDDNGNRFLVESGLSADRAKALVDELSARGHKQTYWVERETEVGPRNGRAHF
ncbi:MAG: hypothetical protein QNJ30_00545 [Kiloniellales bacterium]|nr:hypothetical protein [Kiloniellales bacterium]